MKLLAESWATYRERVMPENAMRLQVVECRRAFYAGAESLYVGIMKGLDPGLEPTEADMARMEDLDKELKQFAADVGAGRA